MELHRHGARLVALGANTSAVAWGVVGLGGFILHGGTTVARRVVEAVAWGPRRGCGPVWKRGAPLVRHHYVCQCVPPCYESHR
jgi:hypothetical protein